MGVRILHHRRNHHGHHHHPQLDHHLHHHLHHLSHICKFSSNRPVAYNGSKIVFNSSFARDAFRQRSSSIAQRVQPAVKLQDLFKPQLGMCLNMIQSLSSRSPRFMRRPFQTPTAGISMFHQRSGPSLTARERPVQESADLL